VLKVHSAVGLIPLLAIATIDADTLGRLPRLASALDRFAETKPQFADAIVKDERGGRVLSLASPARLAQVLRRVFDENEFLSPYGIRSLSRIHESEPFTLAVDGASQRVDYEPGESTTPLFGGNSNWRGPIWMPLNYLAVEAFNSYEAAFGADLTVELPTGSGRRVTLKDAGRELSRRLISIFALDADGRRPVLGSYRGLPDDPLFREGVPFHEYFHADTGAGLGAAHQTGWTGLIAVLLTDHAG
jgi:hypothetical protein